MKPKRININSFDNCSSFYNYRPKLTLNNSMGVGVAKFPSEITDPTEIELNIDGLGLDSVDGVAFVKLFQEKTGQTQNRILLYGSDKKIYINELFFQDTELYWMFNLRAESAPVTLAYKKDGIDTVILTSEEEMKIWKAGYSPKSIENVPIITSMCMNEGVLFCTIKEPAFNIWYATDLGVESVGSTNKNSGYIMLEDDLGYARKVITFDQDVYIFRDYGISKINYVKGEISVTQIYESTTKINCNTVAACGNFILFTTNSGVFSFNGVKVSKTNINIESLLPSINENSVGACLNDKYYLALKLNFGDEKQILCENVNYVNNAILIIDTNDFSFEIIRGVDVKSIVPIKTEVFEKVLLTFNSEHENRLGQIVNTSTCFNDPLPKYWGSGDLVENFNPKVFTKLEVKADKDVKFNLHFEDKTISFTTYKSGINQFCFKIYSKDMKISISSSSAEAKVENVALEYYENWRNYFKNF